MLPASRWRRAFAYYLDLWILAPVVHVMCYAGNIYQYRWPITVALFFLIEWMVTRSYARSLGDYALGITRHPENGVTVDASLKSAANWFAILVGFMELHSASRMVSTGVIEYDVYYFFGRRLSGFQADFFLVFLGLFGLFVSMAVFRCKRIALPLLIGFAAFELSNNLSSHPLLNEFSEIALARRQAARPDRPFPFTAEQMSQLVLVWNIFYLAFVSALGFVFRKRFQFDGEEVLAAEANR